MKVSVPVITYNHEPFIAQAIESILMQQVNFNYEIIIGEDCSTDRTREIVVDFQQRYPDKIRLLLHEKNVGALKNIELVGEAMQGEYAAPLEGDDYWVSPDKLQLQVDFLDSHPDFSMSYGNARIFYEDHSLPDWIHRPEDQKPVSTLEDLIVDENFMHSCTIMYRRSFIKPLPEFAPTLKMTDWLNNVLTAQSGPIGYINEILGAHRMHSGGVWSRLSRAHELQAFIDFFLKINPFLEYQYDRQISQKLKEKWDELSYVLVNNFMDSAKGSAEILDDTALFESIWLTQKLPAGWKEGIRKKVYPKLVFECFAEGKVKKAGGYWLKAALNDPTWLKNRGFWSIGVKSLFSDPMAQ